MLALRVLATSAVPTGAGAGVKKSADAAAPRRPGPGGARRGQSASRDEWKATSERGERSLAKLKEQAAKEKSAAAERHRKEFDEESAIELGYFKNLMAFRCGNLLKAWVNVLDLDLSRGTSIYL